ncbi:MAG: hypothetical protein LPJ89_06285 [Hymenobacteraceae bacterium]|nr:hypothetical protein [Hymenobacteraceae bacterium]MDX5395519.1 hypothetical protein [Hymenobacteraceae bacterium]MDX5443378.1 hypothetical protein [Hymenobacteraceae bacterium]MDX5511573.1 hypothetical protein [Hymenobacteraceae bacterium]
MKAIETTGKIDNKGNLHLNKPLGLREKQVKVIILVSEENDEADEKLWLTAINNNPSFDFLADEKEDIYTLKDGKPFHD